MFSLIERLCPQPLLVEFSGGENKLECVANFGCLHIASDNIWLSHVLGQPMFGCPVLCQAVCYMELYNVRLALPGVKNIYYLMVLIFLPMQHYQAVFTLSLRWCTAIQ